MTLPTSLDLPDPRTYSPVRLDRTWNQTRSAPLGEKKILDGRGVECRLLPSDLSRETVTSPDPKTSLIGPHMIFWEPGSC